ncbi:MAG: hypothetical protein GEV08_03255 [Acidimicrobiia bacterium]|nr:hypothetical protein [Acidimicrobiia bacterium]
MGLFFRPRRPLARLAAGAAIAGTSHRDGRHPADGRHSVDARPYTPADVALYAPPRGRRPANLGEEALEGLVARRAARVLRSGEERVAERQRPRS